VIVTSIASLFKAELGGNSLGKKAEVQPKNRRLSFDMAIVEMLIDA